MVDEGPDGPDVVVKLFGEGEGFPDKLRAALAQSVVGADPFWWTG